MPRSKVRKKAAYTPPPQRHTPVRVHARSSHPLYTGVMLGLLILALAWVIVYHLAGDKVAFMLELGNWNFMIGFALMLAGLFMTMRWR